MFMKHAAKNMKPLQMNFYRGFLKNFSTEKMAKESSMSLRFHELYLNELQRIQKTS